MPILREDSLRLDDRLHDDRVELTGGDLDPLLAQHLDRDGITVRTEITLEGVGLADGEWDCAQEVEEGAVVERILHARLCRVFPILDELRAVGEDLEVALHIAAALVEVLLEAQRVAGMPIDPALVLVVDAIEKGSTTHLEDGVPGGTAAHVLYVGHLHGAGADSESAELHVVFHPLAHAEGHGLDAGAVILGGNRGG